MNFIFSSIQNLPPETVTFFLALLPISELRGALPVALAVFHLPVWSAFLWAFLGNAIPPVFFFLFLPRLLRLERPEGRVKRFLHLFLHRKKDRFHSSFEKYGAFVALAIFVAIPLPLTGAWSGALLAVLLGVPARVGLPAVLLGIIGAGVIVTLIVQGTLGVLSWML
ncbi:MAG TPA: small multi-drug export protein [Patescibacteria group bacterium]|nr:small multi-drug export protein [Patescibacteria group bacterium]